MVSSVLPIYLLIQLQYSPLAFGFIDGLYQGVSAFARLASGILADRWQRYKAMAARQRGARAMLVVTGPRSPNAGELVPMPTLPPRKLAANNTMRIEDFSLTIKRFIMSVSASR